MRRFKIIFSVISNLVILMAVFLITFTVGLQSKEVIIRKTNLNDKFISYNEYQEKVVVQEPIEEKNPVVVSKEIIKEEVKVPPVQKEVEKPQAETLTGNLSAYTASCNGCSGKTASGYDITSTIYYQDKTYGQVRVVSGDRSLPFGSVIKFKLDNQNITGIVLDRGGSVGLGRKVLFDILVNDTKEAYSIGIKKDLKFEILRRGY